MHYLQIREAVAACCEVLLLDARSKLTGEGGEFVLAKVLDTLIWKFSLASPSRGGKYHSCRYWSTNAYREWSAFLNLRRKRPRLVFEHVVPRREIRDQLLKAKTRKDIQLALERVVSCVVLKSEDDKLRNWDRRNAEICKTFRTVDDWWKRYKGAKIRRREVWPDVAAKVK